MGLQPASLLQRMIASLSTLGPVLVYLFLGAWYVRLRKVGIEPVVLLVYAASLGGIVLDAAVNRGLFGMRLMGLCIRSQQGTPIGFWRCLMRVLLGIVLRPLLPISIVLALRDARQRTLADRICRTAVCLEADKPESPRHRRFEMSPLEERQHL